jgi:hypothetical protein
VVCGKIATRFVIVWDLGVKFKILFLFCVWILGDLCFLFMFKNKQKLASCTGSAFKLFVLKISVGAVFFSVVKGGFLMNNSNIAEF